jgi:hypothetical protein
MQLENLSSAFKIAEESRKDFVARTVENLLIDRLANIHCKILSEIPQFGIEATQLQYNASKKMLKNVIEETSNEGLKDCISGKKEVGKNFLESEAIIIRNSVTQESMIRLSNVKKKLDSKWKSGDLTREEALDDIDQEFESDSLEPEVAEDMEEKLDVNEMVDVPPLLEKVVEETEDEIEDAAEKSKIGIAVQSKLAEVTQQAEDEEKQIIDTEKEKLEEAQFDSIEWVKTHIPVSIGAFKIMDGDNQFSKESIDEFFYKLRKYSRSFESDVEFIENRFNVIKADPKLLAEDDTAKKVDNACKKVCAAVDKLKEVDCIIKQFKIVGGDTGSGADLDVSKITGDLATFYKEKEAKPFTNIDEKVLHPDMNTPIKSAEEFIENVVARHKLAVFAHDNVDNKIVSYDELEKAMSLKDDLIGDYITIGMKALPFTRSEKLKMIDLGMRQLDRMGGLDPASVADIEKAFYTAKTKQINLEDKVELAEIANNVKQELYNSYDPTKVDKTVDRIFLKVESANEGLDHPWEAFAYKYARENIDRSSEEVNTNIKRWATHGSSLVSMCNNVGLSSWSNNYKLVRAALDVVESR